MHEHCSPAVSGWFFKNESNPTEPLLCIEHAEHTSHLLASERSGIFALSIVLLLAKSSLDCGLLRLRLRAVVLVDRCKGMVGFSLEGRVKNGEEETGRQCS